MQEGSTDGIDANKHESTNSVRQRADTQDLGFHGRDRETEKRNQKNEAGRS
ncbi:protein of unknown function [Vibrio tapetis subsp. tapetis]|uniref:Uncharacterized protein n=1 Tax=Vibrio tapetis subsp. tapetis TaxID=1671868 RepID=A0A2N8ZM91_9VIBR|nr:protein of unknown function [Vibrio tapetis subsp. tapetis]